MKTKLYHDYVAGVGYTKYQTAIRFLKPGAKLKLYGEPNNQYDPNAVRVEVGGIKVGYIKSTHTASLWEAKKRGAKIEAEVVSFNKTNPTWSMICILVNAIEPKNKQIERDSNEIC